MTQATTKQNHKKFNWYLLVPLFVFIALAATVVVAQMHPRRIHATPAAKSAVGASVKSDFSFSGASDWWQGATNMTSIAVFHKPQDSCFVSAEYKPGTVDVAVELQKGQNTLIAGGYSVVADSTQTLTMQTAAGKQNYQLYQSDVTTPAGLSRVLGGQEFGYLQLSKGYVKIMGYCDTVDELTATISALQAIAFNAAG